MKSAKADLTSLALWAADCAAHVLAAFEDRFPHDKRPRQAIEAGRAWARGELSMMEVRVAAFAAHAAAREANQAFAGAAARAAGHAAATAHVASHAAHAAAYAVKAVGDGIEERDWQYRLLPKHLRPVVFPGYEASGFDR